MAKSRFVTPSGEVREAFAELTGINVTRGLGLLLTDDDSKIGVRCGVAQLPGAQRHRARAHHRVRHRDHADPGRGTVSLRDETLDLRLQGEPKEARLIRVARADHVDRPLAHARDRRRCGTRGRSRRHRRGARALVAPIAAVLPFVDLGLAEDANCGALLARSTRRPARAQRLVRRSACRRVRACSRLMLRARLPDFRQRFALGVIVFLQLFEEVRLHVTNWFGLCTHVASASIWSA